MRALPGASCSSGQPRTPPACAPWRRLSAEAGAERPRPGEHPHGDLLTGRSRLPRWATRGGPRRAGDQTHRPALVAEVAELPRPSARRHGDDMSGRDALGFIACGATAVAVGAAKFSGGQARDVLDDSARPARARARRRGRAAARRRPRARPARQKGSKSLLSRRPRRRPPPSGAANPGASPTSAESSRHRPGTVLASARTPAPRQPGAEEAAPLKGRETKGGRRQRRRERRHHRAPPDRRVLAAPMARPVRRVESARSSAAPISREHGGRPVRASAFRAARLLRGLSTFSAVFVISGPSGAGKGTVVGLLFGSRVSTTSPWAVSATTRLPRPGEAGWS